jgi:hypothetical protein
MSPEFSTPIRSRGIFATRSWILVAGALAIAAIARSDERFVTDARQTAWVLPAGSDRLVGGGFISSATLGEGFAAAELRGTNRILRAGFQPKAHLLPPAPTAIEPASESPVSTSRLRGNAPNPFNPSTAIRIELARAGRTELRIYDVRGRLVRTLLDGPLVEGVHVTHWDGRNDAGTAVASGIYLVQMVAGGVRAEHKMVLAR